MSYAELSTQAGMQSTLVAVEREGQAQIIRLPEDFRLDGQQVEVCRVEGGLLLRPVVAARKWTHEEVDAFWARLDSYGADPLFPDGRDQGTFEVRDAIR